MIPALNEAVDIKLCIASLREQDYPGSYEVVVVDNDSTDTTAEVATSLGATVVHEPTRGVCWARQRGTEIASGAIIVSTDADTTFDPGWLTRIDDAFVADSSCVAVAGPCRFVGGPWWGTVYTTVLFGFVDLLYRLTGRVYYGTATNIAFRKSAWTGYNTSLTQAGDELDLLRRLRAKGKVVFDLANPTFTSARRLRQGLLYNLFVTCLYYYVLGYWLNRLARRPILGTAPAFRGSHPRRRATLPMRVAAVCLFLMLAFLARLDAVDDLL